MQELITFESDLYNYILGELLSVRCKWACECVYETCNESYNFLILLPVLIMSVRWEGRVITHRLPRILTKSPYDLPI